MSNAVSDLKDAVTGETPVVDAAASASPEDSSSFAERYSEVIGKVNETLDKVDWNQMGRIGKIAGIFAAVIVAQILIKGILDTINLLPIVPGLLELLGLVVVGQWSWKNLTTSDKRNSWFSVSSLCVRNIWADQVRASTESVSSSCFLPD